MLIIINLHTIIINIKIKLLYNVCVVSKCKFNTHTPRARVCVYNTFHKMINDTFVNSCFQNLTINQFFIIKTWMEK